MTPRLRTAFLIKRKEEGGVSVSDFQLYHFAALSTCFLDSFHGSRSKRWVSLEYHISSLPPSSILWMGPEHRSKLTHKSFLMSSLLPFSDRHMDKIGLSSRPGPLTPLFGNPDFPATLHTLSICSQMKSPKITICHFLAADRLLPLSHFLADTPSNRDWLQYQQLSSFYSRLKAKHRVCTELLPFEKLCLQKIPPIKTLFFVYNMLREERTKQSPPPYQSKWETDLGHPISPEDWRTIFALTHKSSISGYTQEKNFKVISRWYRTPDLLHKMYPSVPDTCWRCNSASGSYFHIWWDCPEVFSFWQSVFSLYYKVTGSKVDCKPEVGLLSLIQGPLRSSKRGILRHLLAASRQTIAANWKRPVSPPLATFLERVNYIRRMEELTAISTNSASVFYKTWQSWILFVDSSEYISWLTSNVP